MAGKLIDCTCVNPYQDKKYKGKRFANQMGGKGLSHGYRCTSCAKEILPQVKK